MAEENVKTPEPKAEKPKAKKQNNLSLFTAMQKIEGLQKVCRGMTERIDGMTTRIDQLQEATKKAQGEASKARVLLTGETPVKIEYTYNEDESFVLPEPARGGSIGDDLVLTKDVIVPRGRSVIPLNLIINLPPFVEAKIEARSGFSAKGIMGVFQKLESKRIWCIFWSHAVRVETEGRIDADVLPDKVDPGYSEPIGIIIKNYAFPFTIKAGTHLAQITYYRTLKHKYVKKNSVEEFTPWVANRGGGFGHSDNEVECIAKERN